MPSVKSGIFTLLGLLLLLTVLIDDAHQSPNLHKASVGLCAAATYLHHGYKELDAAHSQLVNGLTESEREELRRCWMVARNKNLGYSVRFLEEVYYCLEDSFATEVFGRISVDFIIDFTSKWFELRKIFGKLTGSAQNQDPISGIVVRLYSFSNHLQSQIWNNLLKDDDARSVLLQKVYVDDKAADALGKSACPEAMKTSSKKMEEFSKKIPEAWFVGHSKHGSAAPSSGKSGSPGRRATPPHGEAASSSKRASPVRGESGSTAENPEGRLARWFKGLGLRK